MKVFSALVTGAAGGIGQALCQEFARANYRVIATDRFDRAGGDGPFVRADLRRVCRDGNARNEFRDAVLAATAGESLKVIVNNAAVQRLAPTESVTIEEWDETFDVNLLAPFVLTQLFLPQLKANAGAVINIASIHAALTKPRFVTYATSKAALVGMTRTLAVDLGGSVRVNAILPAAVSTQMLEEGFVGASDERSRLDNCHPIGRISTPKEVARAALFLASDDASFMTGACLSFDGGISSRLYDPL